MQLHNVHAAFTAQYGFSSSARTNPNGTEGNIKFLHLFIDSLALQPCNPTCMFPFLACIALDIDLLPQSPKLVMPGSRPTPTDMVVLTSVSFGRHSPPVVWVSEPAATLTPLPSHQAAKGWGLTYAEKNDLYILLLGYHDDECNVSSTIRMVRE
jgi:hypothetical protein